MPKKGRKSKAKFKRSNQHNSGNAQGQHSSPNDDEKETDGFSFKVIKGDLFTAPESACLCHCVAQDLSMGKGIAVMFKRNFGGLGELRKQQVSVGDVGVLSRGNRFIYHLISKKKTSGYPTSGALASSLKCMRDHAVANGVKHIAMPKIGSGLDRLKWNVVEGHIVKVFDETNIKITVYER